MKNKQPNKMTKLKEINKNIILWCKTLLDTFTECHVFTHIPFPFFQGNNLDLALLIF